MITTEQFELKKVDNLTSSYIEEELKKNNIEPLRWAIVSVNPDKYIVSVAYEK